MNLKSSHNHNLDIILKLCLKLWSIQYNKKNNWNITIHHKHCNNNDHSMLTVRCSSSNISGAIHPSVPAAPDLRENDIRPAANFLQRPKSDIMTRIWPLESGWDSKTLCGFISLWTAKISKVLGFQTLLPEIYIY